MSTSVLVTLPNVRDLFQGKLTRTIPTDRQPVQERHREDQAKSHGIDEVGTRISGILFQKLCCKSGMLDQAPQKCPIVRHQSLVVSRTLSDVFCQLVVLE